MVQLNDLLSLGIHRVWKRTAIAWSEASPGDEVLDVCCGSGDLAMRLATVVGPKGKVTGLDFAANQLLTAAKRERSLPAPWSRPKITCVVCLVSFACCPPCSSTTTTTT
jgi:demethylmenaquinone methyltransferase/2-methoxy-6-polyprenyl-1,4-benzoquinol methylase